jgi:hypothetical protein
MHLVGFSIKASTPGECAISPMFTTCLDERGRMRGARFPTAWTEAAMEARRVVWRKCHRFTWLLRWSVVLRWWRLWRPPRRSAPD